MAEPRNRYSQVSLILHWVIAVLVIGQIALIMMHDATEGGPWMGLHKSVGLSILVLTLARLGWRIANPAIPLPAEMPRWQKLFARGTHVLFYVVLIGMPPVATSNGSACSIGRYCPSPAGARSRASSWMPTKWAPSCCTSCWPCISSGR